jgi:hypothetical protein
MHKNLRRLRNLTEGILSRRNARNAECVGTMSLSASHLRGLLGLTICLQLPCAMFCRGLNSLMRPRTAWKRAGYFQ